MKKKYNVPKKLSKKHKKLIEEDCGDIEDIENDITEDVEDESVVNEDNTEEVEKDEEELNHKPIKKSDQKPKAKKTLYIDSATFQKQVLDYHKTNNITNELGQSIYDIATRLSYAPNFINYSFREEMIGDAVIKMIAALKNKRFNPELGKAFSYFTQIAVYAYWNRIKKEKKAHEVVTKYQVEIYEKLAQEGYPIESFEENHDF